MLAKRIFVAAFAVLAVALVPMAFSGHSDLFVDPPVEPIQIWAN